TPRPYSPSRPPPGDLVDLGHLLHALGRPRERVANAALRECDAFTPAPPPRRTGAPPRLRGRPGRARPRRGAEPTRADPPVVRGTGGRHWPDRARRSGGSRRSCGLP